MKKFSAYLLAVLMVFSVLAVPVSAHSTDLPSNISQWGADIDILLDGYNGLGEIKGYEGNNDKLLGFGNSELDETQYSFTVEMGETEFDTITLYTLDYANGSVMLPEAVTFVVNGVCYDTVITPNDCGIGTIVAELGETVTASDVIVTVTMGTSPYSFGIFHMFSEIEFSESSAEPVIPTDPAEIVDAAYALENGEALSYKATLTGEIIAVNTVYSEAYKNITVTIAIEGKEDMPIQCYRLKGDGVDIIKVGDIITVTGTLKNYHGTIEFDAGCALNAINSTGDEIVMPSTPQEIVDAAYALDQGSTLPYTATLTGEIVSVDTPYEEPYQNITVTIVIDGMYDKPIQCYRLRGDGVDTIKVGDVITVSGTIMNYYGSIEFGSGCSLISVDYTEQAPESGNGGIIYFDIVNNYDWDAGKIILAASNSGSTVFDIFGGNWFAWFVNIKAQKGDDGAFVITDIATMGDTAYESWSICEDEIVIMCHPSFAVEETAGNAEEVAIIESLVIGDKLYLNVPINDLYEMCGTVENVGVSVNFNNSSAEPEVPEEPDVPVSDNIALNKPYEISGCGTNSTYNANLTDGVAYTQMAASGEWFAFQRGSSDGIGCIIIDLENYYNISEVRVNFVNQDSWGVSAPACATVYTSVDGKSFEYAADLPIDSSIQGEAYWSIAEFGGTARYIKVEITLNGPFAFLNEIEVYGGETTYIPEDPVPENYKVEISVNDNAILTDGRTGFDGTWGNVGTGDVLLIANGDCHTVGMDVVLNYDLGGIMPINRFAIDFYHCASVMVGYPEGQILVEVSSDGKSYNEIGYFDIAPANLSMNSYGTVTTLCEFDTIDAAYVRASFYVGSSTDVLGVSPADGKIFWEFISIAEVSASVYEPTDPAEDYYELPVSHHNLYNWGTFESMIISAEGKTAAEVHGYSPSNCVMYVVERCDGQYIATEFYDDYHLANAVVVPEGGFLWYVHNSNSAFEAAADGKLLGYTFVLDGWNLDNHFAIDTLGGSAPRIIKAYAPGTYVPGTPEKPEIPEVPEVDLPSNIQQWIGGADIDVLLDGYNGLGEIKSWEGNNDKLLGFGNSELYEAQYSFTVKMGETEFNRITLYALDYYNGAVVLPQAVTFVVNGNYYDAVITPNDCGIGTIVADLGETVLASEVTAIITMGASPYEFGAFHMFSEIEFANVIPEKPELPLEDQLIIDLGEANADSNLDVIINAPHYYEAGDEITVEVTIQNVSTKIHSLAFQFKYDSSKLWLMNDLDEWENNALMCVELPKNWENFSTVANDYADKKEKLDRVQNDDDETNDESVQILPVNNGIINASILTVSTTGKDAINSITFTFTFKALEDSEGELGFVIPHDSVECARNISTGVNIMKGNGSYAITHIAAILEGYDATCTEDGLTDGLYCPDCGYIIVEQEVIPAHGHDDGEWITVIEPGMGTEGLKELYCTACGEFLASEILPPLYILGDVNNDGEINKYDYMLLKRHVMGTYTLDEIGLLAGDVNNDGTIDKYDYMLLKRHVMGTYVIEN